VISTALAGFLVTGIIVNALLWRDGVADYFNFWDFLIVALAVGSLGAVASAACSLLSQVLSRWCDAHR
jgi:hypothetical protein